MKIRTVVAAARVTGAAALVWRRGLIFGWLTDATARRPSGVLGHLVYRDPKPHYASFRTTLDALSLGPEDRLLELGCGGGTFLELALASGCSAKAIDHSADMVALARDRNRTACGEGRLEVVEGSVDALPNAGTRRNARLGAESALGLAQTRVSGGARLDDLLLLRVHSVLQGRERQPKIPLEVIASLS